MEPITDTGIRGFLKWFETVQPGLAKQVKEKLPTATPEAFSDYNAGGYRTAGLSHEQALAVSALGVLGQDVSSTFDISVPGGIDTAATTPPDVTQAANAGASSTSTTDFIGNIVKGISSLYLTKQQADIQQQVVNTQLARAAAGLPPLPSSLANLGVPQVSVGLSTGTGSMLMLGGAVVLLYLLFGRRSRA